MLDEAKQKRLNLLRYGLVAVTAVAFALGAGLSFVGSGALWTSVLQGVLIAAGMAVLCAAIYALYRSYLHKAA
ncbi:MAG: hypothetical protein GXY76_11115 [Chloroflexi bacterium]|nr:hypothetical protein [Chloroflexota bacterium]